MKTIILGLGMVLVGLTNAVGQTSSNKEEVLLKTMYLGCNFNTMTSSEGETLKYIYVWARNSRYQHIVDINHILIYSKEDVNTLISDLKNAKNKSSERGQTYMFNRDKYSITTRYKYIVLDIKGNYTYINNAWPLKLIDKFIESLEVSLSKFD